MKVVIQSLRLYLVLTLAHRHHLPAGAYRSCPVLFPDQANGSRVFENGKLIGSNLIAQKFTSPRYFWPRPSAADFATVASGASNYGPTSAT